MLIAQLCSKLLILLLRFYQFSISPLLKPSCRFTPTCSAYGIEAIKRYGPVKGLYLLIRRLMKCHPWGAHGFDPVP